MHNNIKSLTRHKNLHISSTSGAVGSL